MKEQEVATSFIVQEVRELVKTLVSTKLVKTVQVSKDLNEWLVSPPIGDIVVGVKFNLRNNVDESKMEILLRGVIEYHAMIADKSVNLDIIKRYLPGDGSVNNFRFEFLILFAVREMPGRGNKNFRLRKLMQGTTNAIAGAYRKVLAAKGNNQVVSWQTFPGGPQGKNVKPPRMRTD